MWYAHIFLLQPKFKWNIASTAKNVMITDLRNFRIWHIFPSAKDRMIPPYIEELDIMREAYIYGMKQKIWPFKAYFTQ